MARILVDTSAVFALVDRSDQWHSAARAELDGLKKARSEPLLTNFIVAECHALVLARLGAPLARKWLVDNVWPVQRVTVDDEAKAISIISQYTDKTFSYADATSFAVMERLGIRKAFAFDPHFRQYGFQVIGLPS
ncbi:MAG: PIN domain-containing protein [Acidobacteriota bacterium]|nr:MAG: PIN domain-containing protein [Acidobacteriota bacterium]